MDLSVKTTPGAGEGILSERAPGPLSRPRKSPEAPEGSLEFYHNETGEIVEAPSREEARDILARRRGYGVVELHQVSRYPGG